MRPLMRGISVTETTHDAISRLAFKYSTSFDEVVRGLLRLAGEELSDDVEMER